MGLNAGRSRGGLGTERYSTYLMEIRNKHRIDDLDQPRSPGRSSNGSIQLFFQLVTEDDHGPTRARNSCAAGVCEIDALTVGKTAPCNGCRLILPSGGDVSWNTCEVYLDVKGAKSHPLFGGDVSWNKDDAMVFGARASLILPSGGM